jgi:hypothetical protein
LALLCTYKEMILQLRGNAWVSSRALEEHP